MEISTTYGLERPFENTLATGNQHEVALGGTCGTLPEPWLVCFLLHVAAAVALACSAASFGLCWSKNGLGCCGRTS
eukprot:2668506-Amphidinium_carterae.1